MKHTISLDIDELNGTFIRQLKAFFGKKKHGKVTIILEDEADETEYLLQSPANRERLLQSLDNAGKGNFITPDLDQYRKLSADA
ncbi:hypothetical protein [Runella sp.]|uniref:hypothetical protein n=1 Tax=Runella sp. TaxID=1960881 RepID=UPI003D0E2EAE